MTDATRDAIERFVRGTLGCHCPDEVFRSIAVDLVAPVAGRPPALQLLIGSRLLIHIVSPPADPAAAGWIEQLAAHGRAARDRHGYNRFRLVITVPPGTTMRGEVESRFARAVAGEDRAHVHLIGSDGLPAGLEVPGAPG
jgi:hypothetical protein